MKVIAFFLLAFLMTPALAWNGQDAEQGTNIMLSSRTMATPGQEVVYYDYSKEEYRTAEVTSVYGFGKSVQIELYDIDTGINRTFEMEE